MDLESTLSTIAATIPEEIEQAVSQMAYYIPGELRAVMRHASAYLPTEVDFVSVAVFLLYFAAASLILGIIGRVVLGKRSSLNHSLSSAMAIAFLYAMTIVIYTFKPWNLELLLSPLPFATFSEHYLILLPISDLEFPALCTQVLSLVILLGRTCGWAEDFQPGGAEGIDHAFHQRRFRADDGQINLFVLCEIQQRRDIGYADSDVL